MQFPPMCCFRSIPLLFVSWSFFCFATSFAVGQDGETLRLEIDSLEQDYAQQLPRIAPHEARESLDTFTLDTRFRIEQVAAEPGSHTGHFLKQELTLGLTSNTQSFN